jgi:hypothetical protein
LYGTLPSTIGGLNNLREFLLNDNSMEGTLPTELGLLSQLTVINLASNTFSGSLPSELIALPNLEYLDLFQNSLNGFLPDNIIHVSYLITLDFAGSFWCPFPEGVGSGQSVLSSNVVCEQCPLDVSAYPSIGYCSAQQDCTTCSSNGACVGGSSGNCSCVDGWFVQ